MIGDIKYPAGWTMEQLAFKCTENENLSFARLTTLGTMNPPANLAHFVKDDMTAGLNDLVIVARGVQPNAPAYLLFNTNIYVSNNLTAVDVYRRN